MSVADALLALPVAALPPEERFIGAGVYAIYYVGSFPPYERVAALNREERFEAPIYVGKAVPPGARKGGFGLDTPAGAVLYSRLREHSRSINQVQGLELKDFQCRYLVVEDIWIPLGENLLIEWFQPIWNKVIDGFGIHKPGRGREKQRRSLWDTLHPGRPLAEELPDNDLSREEILGQLASFLPEPRPAHGPG